MSTSASALRSLVRETMREFLQEGALEIPPRQPGQSDETGASLGALPDPAVVESLGLPRIPRKEGNTQTAAVSEALGDAVAEPSTSRGKGGSPHNPAKGKQPRQGKEKQPAQEKPAKLVCALHVR